MKKFFIFTLLILLIPATIIWFNLPKLTPYYTQLTKPRVGLNLDLQPKEQKGAQFISSEKCKKCHEENYHNWKNSMHSKMIQDIKKDPSVVIADFTKLPEDADFSLAEAVYTIGSKFKQRYMIPSVINGKEDFRLGNYQWNTQNKNWQHFKPYKYWYKNSYPHNNKEFPTSNTCDGCHFTGYMSTEKRVERAIACESCHGPGSAHAEDPDSPLFKASLVDPIRTNEVCLQCHMRNRDKRIETEHATAKNLWMKAKDYPAGYEPGKSTHRLQTACTFCTGKRDQRVLGKRCCKKEQNTGK